MKMNSVKNESYVQYDTLLTVDEGRLVISLTGSLIQNIALAMSGDTVHAGGDQSDVDQISVLHGKKQIELLFAEIRQLIENDSLPPRFVAELVQHYFELTGRHLKSDLGVHAIELDRCFQVAIDVASRQNL